MTVLQLLQQDLLRAAVRFDENPTDENRRVLDRCRKVFLGMFCDLKGYE